MSRNGTPAIILIYLMTMLPVFMDNGSQRLADATSTTSARINLYSTFKDRLNASANFAESEYHEQTLAAVNKIYDLAAKILTEQLKQQQQTIADSKNANYPDKLVEEPDPSRSRDILPPAVASTTANTAAEVAKKNAELINAQVVGGSDAVEKQSEHRQARKIHKENRRSWPRPHRTKKPYPSDTSTPRRQSSRTKWANRRMRPLLPMPMGGEEEYWNWILSPISAQSQAGQSAILKQAEEEKIGNMNDDDWRWRRSENESNPVPASKTNGLARSIRGDDGGNRHGLPSDKWRRKSSIDGKRKNWRNCRSFPSLLEEQSNELIESDAEWLDGRDERERRTSRTVMGDYRPRKTARSSDSFPEVFSGPLADSSSLSVIGAENGLNEAIKNANTLLSSVPNIANSPSVSTGTGSDDISRRSSQPFDVSTLTGSISNVVPSQGTGDANAANLTNVMEKVLGELESLRECKGSENVQPEGSPCDVIGTWNSEIIGLQLHISLADTSSIIRSCVEGKKMEIELTERVPPRRHELMDCDWHVTGSTVKQFGGPFYITAQKSDRYLVATFAGLCKICGGIPTVFGSWTFVYPAKDCQDVSLAVENKRDVFRKDNLEAKRKHRFERVKGKCLTCS